MMALQFFQSLIQLFYPRICPGCGSDAIGKGESLCLRCLSDLPYTFYNQSADNKMAQMFYGRIKIESAMSLLYFSKHSLVQNIMHEFKYNGGRELGMFLGNLMGKAINESELFRRCEVLVPLPLHASKEKKRGYNQSEILCRGIQSITGQALSVKNVIRTTPTESQTHKHRTERWDNVEGTFEVSNPDALRGKHVLLVDDVVTTGSTLEACADAILHLGQSTKVSVATLAVASK